MVKHNAVQEDPVVEVTGPLLQRPMSGQIFQQSHLQDRHITEQRLQPHLQSHNVIRQNNNLLAGQYAVHHPNTVPFPELVFQQMAGYQLVSQLRGLL